MRRAGRVGRFRPGRARDVTGPAADCARVHAYLHRKEGDLSNARYWYARANKSPATDPLDDEWAAIVTELLRPSPSRS